MVQYFFSLDITALNYRTYFDVMRGFQLLT